MKPTRAPKHEPAAPPTARDVFRARVRLHGMAEHAKTSDAVFLIDLANRILPLVPVVEDDS